VNQPLLGSVLIQFSPDHKDGRTVRSRMLVNVVFNPTGAAH
jgi:hypothetical protein